MALFGRKETPAPTPAPAPVAELTGEARKQMHLERIVEYVKSQNWNYSVDGNRVIFNMGIKSKLSSVRNLVIAGEKEIQCFAACPIKAKPEDYAKVVEFITRANYGLKNGNFDFDYRDGEVRYHTCLRSTDGMPSLREIEFIVDIPMLMMQRYGDGLAKNLMGFGDPEKDIAEIENQ